MILCGIVSDRMGKQRPVRKFHLVAGLCSASSVLLLIAFSMPPGKMQLAMIGLGMFFAAGSSGPAGAMVANLTNPSVHGSAFAALTLANNLLGLAPAPFVTGMLADRFGLQAAFELIPIAGLVATAIFILGKRSYESDLLGDAARESHGHCA
jgi:MFS family permease